jgi:hypothetical protein
MIIERKMDPIRVICECRKLKALMVLTQAEFYFVASSQELNSDEKMVWFALACESASNAELSCILSYQHLSELVGQSTGTVYDAIQRLNKIGYISACNEEEQDRVGHKLRLPATGLLKLKQSPKIRDFNNREYIHALRCGNDPVLSNTLNTFPVNSQVSPLKPYENLTARTTKSKPEKSRGPFCSTSPPGSQKLNLMMTAINKIIANFYKVFNIIFN